MIQSSLERKITPRKKRTSAAKRAIYLIGTYETRLQWEQALKDLEERIEEERSKVIPLKFRALSRPRARKQVKLLEELIVEYTRLKLAGQEVFPR